MELLNKLISELDVPYLALPESAYGATGYLDGLLNSEMDHPVMKGFDKFGRQFLALRVTGYTETSEGKTRPYLPETRAEVVFKRYSNKESPDVYVSAGSVRLAYGAFQANDLKNLENLLQEGRVEFPTGILQGDRRVIVAV